MSNEGQLYQTECSPDFFDEWIAECRERAYKRIPHPIRDEVWSFRPWGHRCVMLRRPPDEKSPGGIVIPARAQELMAVGWIVSIGPEVHLRDVSRYASVVPYGNPLDLVGEEILIGRFAGQQLPLSTTEQLYAGSYVVITAGDIWGVLRDPASNPHAAPHAAPNAALDKVPGEPK
jgi:co-chaperonin GroES (HSP10)